ncbi:MAG TPA: glucose-1-phosphate thymidylyltransferase [bacterium]|nr:glucose-1-phosphate thymidylyltransferase [bacterium]HPP88207.1 glucose-1-phosphate thymidylyltransferase [bacterium]
MLKFTDFFDITNCAFAAIFEDTQYVWEAITKIKKYLKSELKPNLTKIPKFCGTLITKTLVLYNNEIIDSDFEIEYGDALKGKLKVIYKSEILPNASVICAGAYIISADIYLGTGSIIEPGAYIKGPAYIGDNTEIRQGAYIRGDALIGDKCVVGHTTEIKNSAMLGDSKAGHFAYIGDSILGAVNLGAGTKLANLKMNDSLVKIKIGEQIFDTGLRKFGAILADGVETGCNSVTSPGTIIGKNSMLYPNTTARGFIPENSIIKNPNNIVKKI